MVGKDSCFTGKLNSFSPQMPFVPSTKFSKKFFSKTMRQNHFWKFSEFISNFFFLKKLFHIKNYFDAKNRQMQIFKYDFFDEFALNKMEKCPLCCESQQSETALAIHIKKIHPQRNVAMQIVQ